MNLITPERRLAGAREIRAGRAFCLSLPLDYPGGTALTGLRAPPRRIAAMFGDQPAYNMVWPAPDGVDRDVVCDDAVLLFTQYSTQWDALSHWGQLYDGIGDGVARKTYYNGYRADEHIAADGEDGPCAHALGIENLAETSVQGRAVLVDLLAAEGPERNWIGYDRLRRAMDTQSCDLRTGDFLLLRTGYADELLRMAKQPDVGRLEQTGAVLDGHDPALLRWIDESGIVAICADNIAVEGYNMEEARHDGHGMLPLHELCLFKLGIHLGELWHLGPLADWLAVNKRTACFLTAPPLRLPGAVGSPVTPVATV